MSEIIYTSLIKFPVPITSKKDALEYLYQFVKKPEQLNNIKTEIIVVDKYHINIVRYFSSINEYKSWIFSKERNEADQILMNNSFYLYTKQAHLNDLT